MQLIRARRLIRFINGQSPPLRPWGMSYNNNPICTYSEWWIGVPDTPDLPIAIIFFYRYVETGTAKVSWRRSDRWRRIAPSGFVGAMIAMVGRMIALGKPRQAVDLVVDGVFREEESTEVASRKRGRKRREAQGEQRGKKERSLISKSRIL